MKHFFKRIFKRTQTNEGFSNLEMAIGTIILMTIISVGIAFSQLSVQHFTLSSNLNYISNVVQQQGGIETSKPSHYRGKYATSSEVYQNIQTALESVGFSESEWSISINGQPFTSTTTTDAFDHGTRVSIELRYEQKFPLISQVIHSDGKISKRLHRQVITTYYHRPETSNDGNITFE